MATSATAENAARLVWPMWIDHGGRQQWPQCRAGIATYLKR